VCDCIKKVYIIWDDDYGIDMIFSSLERAEEYLKKNNLLMWRLDEREIHK
jgi:hypothetical protein